MGLNNAATYSTHPVTHSPSTHSVTEAEVAVETMDAYTWAKDFVNTALGYFGQGSIVGWGGGCACRDGMPTIDGS